MIGNWLRRISSPHRAALLYEVTARCNLNCAHCYNVWKGGAPYSNAELPTRAAIDLVHRAVHEFRCTHFTFTGGEPTLRRDLEDLVQAARSVCEQVSIITNGTLLDDRRTASLVDAGIALFELALNSANKSTHNRMAGGSDCFDRVTRAATEIRARGADLVLVFVGTSENIEDWEDTLELGIALGAQGFLLNRYNAGGESHNTPEALMPSVDQVRRALGIAERYAAEYGVGISVAVPIPPCLIDPREFPHVGFGFCPVGTERAYWTIDPLGNVRPCNHSPIVLGNILGQSYRHMKRSAKLAEFMKALPQCCSTCPIRQHCHAGCRAAAQACYGTLSAREPFLELNAARIAEPTG